MASKGKEIGTGWWYWYKSDLCVSWYQLGGEGKDLLGREYWVATKIDPHTGEVLRKGYSIPKAWANHLNPDREGFVPYAPWEERPAAKPKVVCTCGKKVIANQGCPSARGEPCPGIQDRDMNPYLSQRDDDKPVLPDWWEVTYS